MQYALQYFDKNIFLTRDCKRTVSKISRECLFSTYESAKSAQECAKNDKRIKQTYGIKYFKVVGVDGGKIIP